MLSAKQWPFCSGLDVLTHNNIRFLWKSVKILNNLITDICSIISTPLFSGLWKICIVSTLIFEKKWGNAIFRTFFVKKNGEMYSADYPFWPFIAFRVNGRYWAFLSHNQVPPPPTALLPVKFPEMQMSPHLNIRRKHRLWAYILGFIELPYFGSE